MRILDQMLRWALILAVGILTTSVFLQVLTRFVLRIPLAWTEEVSRIAFVYCIFIGATLGIRDRAHINVDFVVALLPPGGQLAMKMISNLLVATFLIFVIWQGVDFVVQTGVQMTPVLLIPFRYLYVIIPGSAAIMLLYLVVNAIEDLRRERTS